MSRIPTPLTWRRRTFAVFEPRGMVDRLFAVAVRGIVAGPFAIYSLSPSESRWHKLIHLPSQARIIELEMQAVCKDAAEKFAALDLNWWSCIPEEVIGPDLQEMKNLHARLKPDSYFTRDVALEWQDGKDR